MQCQSKTKRHIECLIEADRYIEGKWYCHVHDPRGIFQLQRIERKTRQIKMLSEVINVNKEK
jgi:hypothetical protein